MKNRRMLLPVLLSIALVFSLILPVEAKSGAISWSPQTIELELFPGTSTIASATFVADDDFTDVSLWVVPELQQFIGIQPQSFDRTNVGVQQAVVLFVSIPYDTAPDTYAGTLHIRVGRCTLPQTLKITLHVEEANFDVIPPIISLPSEDRIVDDPNTGTGFVRDEILVGFVPGTPQEAVIVIVSSVGGIFLGAIPELDLYQIQVAVADLNELRETIEQLETEEAVSFAVRHWLYKVEIAPNDPRFDTWDEGNPAGNNWGQELVNLPSAWEYSTGEQSVRIAVVDTGFDVQHEDFADNIYYTQNTDLGISRLLLPMWQAVTTHGTNVAGMISAQGNNAVGIAGVMWDCSLLLYGASLAESRIIIGLTPRLDPVVAVGNMIDAITRGAKVINFSAGALTASEEEAESASAPYERVLEWAEHTDRDVLFVFAAGNDASDASLVAPATLAREYPNVISVAAVGRTSELSSWSNFGPAVNVAAPGEDIYTTFPFNPPFGLSGDYDWTQGTSFAAPFVTGLAGLIWSVDTSLTAAEVKQLIVGGAEAGDRQVPGHDFYISNAYESLKLAQPVVYFPDPNLEAVIREAIGKPTGPIYASDLEGLTHLRAYNRGIVDLTGLEHCTDLVYLNLSNNDISNISQLSGLTRLYSLAIDSNQISNISPLSGLTNLRSLFFNDNQISNISPLSGLTRLHNLMFARNQVSNISPLSSLTDLRVLELGSNQIHDISPLSSMTKLTFLSMGINQISNIFPLSGLTSLEYLLLPENQISNISPLAGLISLEHLWLRNNQISDIKALIDNPGISSGDYVWLQNNPLSPTSIGTYIPQLQARGVVVHY